MPARNGGKGRFNALTAIKGAVEGRNREVAPFGQVEVARERGYGTVASDRGQRQGAGIVCVISGMALRRV